jgi:glycosyltransferase involved in cell wall biosynthesis
MGLVVGIDASRIRSGGGIAHLLGILNAGDPFVHGINRVHVWSYKSLLNMLPDTPWLIKHNPPILERTLIHQVWWQFHSLSKEARRENCDVLFAADAATVCSFCPSVVMSQDMLSYEQGQMRHYGLSAAHLRLILIRFIQTRAMKRAHGVIFLTNYAKRIIQGATGKLRRVSIITHGVGDAFRQTKCTRGWPEEESREIRCLYVSIAAMYKHQWVVVKAIGDLRSRGHKVGLLLAGGGTGRAQRLTDEAIAEVDPQREFIEAIDSVPHEEIPELLTKSDIFIFASSCENMPITLLEAMAAGLPIACSDRGPMPEILEDGGVYFDPESSASISTAIEKIISSRELRTSIAWRAKELSEKYSWARCANETWEFLRASVFK